MTELLQLPTVCLKRIVSFGGCRELCALDATSRAFGALTEPVWACNALQEFGIRSNDGSGKAAWRKGKAVTSPERNKHFIFQLRASTVGSERGAHLASSTRMMIAQRRGDPCTRYAAVR